MAVSQFHMILRRVAHWAGHSLIQWACRFAARTGRTAPIAQESALRRYRARRELESEQQKALNVNAFAWLRL